MSSDGSRRLPSQESVDQLSLEQALLDAEVALARAHDLALRLVELRAELADERGKNIELTRQVGETRELYDAIVNNRAYRMASKAWALRRAIGV